MKSEIFLFAKNIFVAHAYSQCLNFIPELTRNKQFLPGKIGHNISLLSLKESSNAKTRAFLGQF
jgi:hypothetical protein